MLSFFVKNFVRLHVLGGETYYYIKIVKDPVYYSIAASKAEAVIILNTGNKITVTFTAAAGNIIPADSVKVVK